MKGVHLFKTHLTKSIYEEFLTELKIKKSLFDTTPFVYVDPDSGEISLLAGSFSNSEGDFNAVSVQHRINAES